MYISCTIFQLFWWIISSCLVTAYDGISHGTWTIPKTTSIKVLFVHLYLLIYVILRNFPTSYEHLMYFATLYSKSVFHLYHANLTSKHSVIRPYPSICEISKCLKGQSKIYLKGFRWIFWTCLRTCFGLVTQPPRTKCKSYFSFFLNYPIPTFQSILCKKLATLQ